MAIQMFTEQFRELLRTYQGEPTVNTKNVTHCTARYDGLRSATTIEEFVTTVSIYKQVEGITDENALTGLPLLLVGEANQWWNDVKTQASTWDQAITLIKRAHAPVEPNYKILNEIYTYVQPEKMPIDRYITIQRDLFSRLSGTLTTSWQIDIMFGSLKNDIRGKLRREEITMFEELLGPQGTNRGRFPTGSKTPRNQGNNTGTTKRKTRARCEYCRIPSHTAPECRKRQANETQLTNTTMPRPLPPEKIHCYGCNAPGVFRRNCPQCNRDTGSNTNVHVNIVGFCSTRLKPRSRPAVTIQVAATTRTAFLDTAAESSVASVSLFQRLRETNHSVHYETIDATFADGSTKTMTVPTIRTNIALHGRVIATTFVALSENAGTKALLGADFIEDAGLVPDLAAKRFHFRDDADVIYPMTPMDGVIEITSQQSNDLGLAVAETAPRPTTVHTKPIEAENYGPPIPGTSIAVQPPGVWNIYQAPGAFEYTWADADSATDMFTDATDYATPLEFSSLNLKTQEGADYTPNERAALLQG
jgi:hypothetical protein